MTASDVRMIVLSTDNLDKSIDFYARTLGFSLKFRDGNHFAALDGGSVSVALATLDDHPIHGRVVVGVRTDDVEAAAERVRKAGGHIVREPYDDAHERRAVVFDDQGNGLVLYSPLPA
ncbi:VOC family protein [Pseudarthrobacter sp. H3Y2-7]|uniref:VOC family protein n=1 Tax=Pseudarthrobacter naphthalenicus TaxID=3031328 RepID=UPI0023B12C0A|nr:VOC family protein [Pseudarthrobacter sp. H3Y2-7]MDE8670916.1 VOC family protein [Pseudarthrobacter sp. H3Y2-7]